LFDRCLGVNNCLALLSQERELSLEYFYQYVFFAREIVEEGALRNVHPLGNILHCGALKSLLIEELLCHSKDGITVAFFFRSLRLRVYSCCPFIRCG